MNDNIILNDRQSDDSVLFTPTDFESLFTLLEAGGPVAVILLIISVIALAIILLKLWQFFSLQLRSTRIVDDALAHWRAGRRQAALISLKPSPNPVAQVIAVAIHGHGRSGVTEIMIREEAARIAGNKLETLRSHFRSLELIGALSPLLGLLGTVFGMIEAFQQLQAAGNRVDPGVLSGGIWQALLTTAIGLAVAIPTVAALSGLERTVERTRHRMDDALTQVFTIAVAVPGPAVRTPLSAPVLESSNA